MDDHQLQSLTNQAAEVDICDLLFRHFEDFGRWNWCEISDEGRRVNNIMFSEEVEYDSPLDAIWAAVAAQSTGGAFAAVAAAIGIEAKILESAVEEWYENQDDPPDAVGLDGLQKKITDSAERARVSLGHGTGG